MAACLGEEPQLSLGCFWLPRAMGQGHGQKSVYGLAQLPIIKLSLIAAYLWFPLTAPASPPPTARSTVLRVMPNCSCHCQFSIDMALLVFPLL